MTAVNVKPLLSAELSVNGQTSHLIKRPGSGDDVTGAAFKQQAEIIPDKFDPLIL